MARVDKLAQALGAKQAKGEATKGQAQAAQTAAAARERATAPVEFLAPDTLTPSRYQPPARPSAEAVQAVRDAVVAAGSLAALFGWDGEAEAPAYRALQGEARALAELTADVGQRGVEAPLETVDLPDGTRELVTGHRRLAAARLAGRATVPVRHLGPMSHADAAALVLRDNLHRADFTAWQAATALRDAADRLAESDPAAASVRRLAALMGFSVGRTSEMLRFARRFDRAALEQIGGGDIAAGEAWIARTSYVQARKLAQAETDAEALAQAETWARASRESPDETATPAPLFTIEHQGRAGGFVLRVRRAVEELPPAQAEALAGVLAPFLAKLRRRAKGAGGPSVQS